jgi:hypothetical protein
MPHPLLDVIDVSAGGDRLGAERVPQIVEAKRTNAGRLLDLQISPVERGAVHRTTLWALEDAIVWPATARGWLREDDPAEHGSVLEPPVCLDGLGEREARGGDA